MDFLPLIIRAEYRQGYRIRLTFDDGPQKTVDTNARAWLKRPPESLASAGGGDRIRTTLGDCQASQSVDAVLPRRCPGGLDLWGDLRINSLFHGLGGRAFC